VKGGLSRITSSAVNLLGSKCVSLNAPVTEIHHVADGRIELVIEGLAPQRRIFDKVILALPPAAIQGIQIRPQWSYLKERAVRTIHEGPLYKMGLHFRTRFWENMPDPCFGGQTQTDLRIRWIVYPSNDLGSSQSGCLIVYSGMTDALRWSWMAPWERVKLVLKDLDCFFSLQGINVYEHFIEASDINWPSKISGGNTMYLPGQHSRFHEVMKQPEGNVYFAGEHISRHHTWVAGAIESAHHTVEQVLDTTLMGLGATRIHPTAPVELGISAAGDVVVHGVESENASLDGALAAVMKLEADLRNHLSAIPADSAVTNLTSKPISIQAY
jgi:monoamine oxidase